jgi:sterol desaturase/sphingolipid hydroxylase (fatty acid hydroxylase superfamily)
MPASAGETSSVVRWGFFPLVMGGAIAAMVAMMDRGVTPVVALVVVEAIAAVAVIAGERVWPFEARWNRAHGDLGADVGHAVVSGGSAQRILPPLLQPVAAAAGGAITAALGSSVWPVAWPWLAQLALALLVAEFFQYWLHRFQHERDLLWRFHAVHHSAPRLYWLNAARFHPADLWMLYAVGYVPLIALGCPAPVFALYAMFDVVLGLLQHSNVDVRLGPLNRIFSMAEPHRWHHSRVLREANSNYGSNLSVWDVVFGTFHLPDRRPPSEIGIEALPRFPRGYLAQLAAPFRWARVQRESAPPRVVPPARSAGAGARAAS